MKNFLIAALFAVLPFTVYAQAIEETPQGAIAQFRSKPVLCMNKDEMMANAKRNNMLPLVGALGNSFDGQQSTFPAFFLVVYNADKGTYSFLEFHKDGWACLLGGGENGLIFDYEEIDRQLDWD
jgi:hypothetical protein